MNQEEFDFIFELEPQIPVFNSCLKVNCDQRKKFSPSESIFTEMNQEEFDFMFELEHRNSWLKVNCDQTKKLVKEFQQNVWNKL